MSDPVQRLEAFRTRAAVLERVIADRRIPRHERAAAARELEQLLSNLEHEAEGVQQP